MTVARAAQDEVEAVRKEMQEKVKMAQEAADRQVRVTDRFVITTLFYSRGFRSEPFSLLSCCCWSGEGTAETASGAPERADVHPGGAGLPEDHHGLLTAGYSSQLYYPSLGLTSFTSPALLSTT